MNRMANWLTVKQIALHLQISQAQVYAMARDGRLPASKVGSQWRFDQYEIDDMLKNHGQVREK